MKVLVLLDVWGWAFHWVAQGIQKYSKHDVTIKRWNEVERMDSQTDVLFCMNDSIWYAMDRRQSFFEGVEKKCVGIRGEEMPCDRILKGWTVGAVNKKIYNELNNQKPSIKGLYLTQNGVDTDIFQPNHDKPENRFKVGWCGNPTQPLKRFELLSKIPREDFPMILQTNWGPQFFSKSRDRSEMVNFYNHIDCFINVSEHEGMPQSILEAGATALPIVCTGAGGMAEFVDGEWVIPTYPPEEAVRALLEKLELLKNNPKLRREVGERNLQKVLSEWSWKDRVKQYDLMFEEA